MFFVIGAIVSSVTNAENSCIIPVIRLVQSAHTLDLKGKNISQICSGAFVGFDTLTKLDLSRNDLTDLSKDIFKPLRDIITIDLSENKLTTIRFDVFSNNERFRRLNLRFNAIKTIETIQHSGNLTIQQLFFHVNNLRDVSELCKLTKLDHLELSSNQNVDFNIFNSRCFSGLKALELVKTGLKRLNNNYQLFSGLKELLMLKLPENNLEVFCVENFPELPALTELDIKENGLKSIDAEKLKGKFPSLNKIHLSKNLWSCDYFKSLKTNLINLIISVETKQGDENCNPTITAPPRPNKDVCESQTTTTTTATSTTTPTKTTDPNSNSDSTTIQPNDNTTMVTPTITTTTITGNSYPGSTTYNHPNISNFFSVTIIWSLLIANGILFVAAIFLGFFYFLHG
jgi:Leucine rich repeat